jgi:Flp pilus assembly protein TadD
MAKKAESAAALSTVETRTLALQSNPDDPKAHTSLGWALHNAGESEEAIEVLEGARKRFKNDVELLYALGLALKQAGKNKKAKTVFKDLLAVKESSVSATKTTMFRRLAQNHMDSL